MSMRRAYSYETTIALVALWISGQVAASAPPSCCSQLALDSLAWESADPRITVSLWDSSVRQGTQIRCSPDGSLWVLELRGRLLRLSPSKSSVTAETILLLGAQAESADPECGATGFDFGQDFDGRSGTIYVTHNWDDEDGSRLGGMSLVRLRNSVVVDRRLIFGPIISAGAHQVDRVVCQGGVLWLSVGDVWNPALSQRDGPYGKVLRFSEAEVVSGSAQPTRIVKGLRSPFGLGRRESDGLMIVANNGENSDDGLYVVTQGANFGWGADQGAAADSPLHVWRKTVCPTSICFYEPAKGAGAAHPWPREFLGNLLVPCFGSTEGGGPDRRPNRAPPERGRQVYRFELESLGAETRVTKVSVLLSYNGSGFEAPVDLACDSDGDVYLLTLNVDPAGPFTSKIYRMRAHEHRAN